MPFSAIGAFGTATAARTSLASCPTCGPGGTAKASTARAFTGGHTGRTDSFSCTNCGPAPPKTSATTPTRAATSSSLANCPGCVGSAPARSQTPFSSPGNTYSCPTCNTGTRAGSPTLGFSSAATSAPRVASAFNNNTTAWAR